jgi:hypothetical protein
MVVLVTAQAAQPAMGALLSVSPFSLAKRPQSDEPDLALHLRLNGLSREPNLPANPRPVAHAKLAKAIELQRESIRPQMIEQGGLQAPNHRVEDVLSLFLRRQRQSSLNPLGQLISTSYARMCFKFLSGPNAVSKYSNGAEDRAEVRRASPDSASIVC